MSKMYVNQMELKEAIESHFKSKYNADIKIKHLIDCDFGGYLYQIELELEE